MSTAMVTYSNPTADAVRAELARRSLTYRDAARAAGVHYVTFCYKARGQRPFTEPELRKLAQWLGVPVATLVPEAA